MPASESAGQNGVSADAIVDAALDIIVAQGLPELTLRPLALKLGVSVAVISARMGTKEQLIERVVAAAAARDGHFFDRWLAFARELGATDARARAALTDLAFRDWLARGRRQALFLIELVHDRALQDAPWPALDAWLDRAGTFWSTLLFGTDALSDPALGYILDEAGFALGSEDDPGYALLRLLCLQRFADGLLPRDSDPACTAIPRLIAMLEPHDLPGADLDDPKRGRIADSAAQIIVSQGIEAVTHRSVALAAGVPASTVVYHFGARAALVVAGLHAVITHFHAERDKIRGADGVPGDDASARDLVKATSMIALASVRAPSLIPHALDMRRRRGENIRAGDLAWLGFGPGDAFDRAAAQVISIALFGMRMVAMARKIPERDHYRGAFAALAAWRATEAAGRPS